MKTTGCPTRHKSGEDQLGMGAHTDYGIVNVLGPTQVPGLEVHGADECWHPVMPADGALLVTWATRPPAGRTRSGISTLHRVGPRRGSAGPWWRGAPPPTSTTGNVDGVIECLPSCVSAANRPGTSRSRWASTWAAKLAARAAASSTRTRPA